MCCGRGAEVRVFLMTISADAAAEVSHINGRGVWLCVHDKEYFLPYDEYPWFRDAKVRDML